VERAAFKQFALLESRHWWFAGRRRLYPALLAHVLQRDRVPGSGLRIVDVGCGVGGFLEPLQRFGRVLGLELDEPAIAFCRERGHADTAVAICDALPLPRESQDLVCLWDVLEHTPDDARVLKEALDCLKPGGHLALSVPAYGFLFANNDRVAHHHRRYTRGEVRRKLREAGFEVRKATYVNVVLSVVIIPAVLLIKLKERVMPVPEDPTSNLTWPVPRPLNALLGWVFASERHVLSAVNAPFGHSIFAVARRPAG
jgi:SAM-dependent methyltransferase